MKRCNNCGWFNLDSATQCEKCEEESFDVIEESPAEESAPEVEEPKAEPVVEAAIVEEPVVEAPVVEEPVEPVAEEVAEESVVEEPQRNPMLATVIASGKGVATPKEEPKAKKRRVLAATVMDARAELEKESVEESCPKCCYPISGDMEYCPNCGATIRSKKQEPVCKETIAEQSEPSPALNATVALGAEAVAMPKASEAGASKFAKATVAIGAQEPAQPKAEEAGASKFAKATVALDGAQKPVAKSAPKNLKATVREVPSLVVDDSDENTFRLEPVDALGEAPIELKLDGIVEINGKRYKFVK